MKQILIIAGPNGAGKTTFAKEYLPQEERRPEFINADLIAAGLSPFRPERVAFTAGRLMLDRIRRLTNENRDVAFETTLATRSYLKRIPQWRASGYFVKLCFLKLPDPDFAIRRVALRVLQGGHDIPTETIRRRFQRGWALLQAEYLLLVDEWAIYDSSVIPNQLIKAGSNPPSTSIMEESTPYRDDRDDRLPEYLLNDPGVHGAGAALARASAKAIERARAAGLDPVIFSPDQPPPK